MYISVFKENACIDDFYILCRRWIEEIDLFIDIEYSRSIICSRCDLIKAPMNLTEDIN